MTFTPKHILVPVSFDERDGLQLADYLVDVACDLARVHAATLTLMTVVRSEAQMRAFAPELPGSVAAMVAESRRAEFAACERALDALTARARRAGIEATSAVVDEQGDVAETIRDVARGRFADLIVLCTHARKGWRRFLLGSVAERVVHIAEAPVLLVKPPWPVELGAPPEAELAGRDAR